MKKTDYIPSGEDEPVIGSTARLEAFSDGIFGVAITLLAIDLKAPDLEIISNQALLASLGERWPEYLAVLNSFASVLLMWVNHHDMLKLVGRVGVPLMLANGLLLLLVVCVPYPTSTLSRYILTDAARNAAIFYSGYFAFVNLSFRFLWRTIATNHRFLRPGVTQATIATFNNSQFIGIPAYTAIALVAFISPIGSVVLSNAMWIYWVIASGKMQNSSKE